ncbi:N(4)-acetylcytidine aminohydrolase [Vibrio sp. 16]|uniref:N(4)-acetylcytidine aminohydrolase n=1 Tax=Vibrio sp. 16 TaxID=391586 RepID=UPI00018F3889|nr:N(4)-acetylcytidine aminohydrolase [Vibrio sp. 16]EED26932.1 conserved hypothetical protein [Vibrio sp. 16]CAK4074018.1 hypothetical protein VDT1_3162 [Vibrio sp. 16]
MTYPTKMTFFEFLTPLVAAGKKTITIRDESEADYVPGTTVEVYTLETDTKVCDVKILSVEPLHFDDINEFHAEQEYIELPKLKQLIREIYPNNNHLFVIHFELV